jgi:phosphoheptose isomerase
VETDFGGDALRQIADADFVGCLRLNEAFRLVRGQTAQLVSYPSFESRPLTTPPAIATIQERLRMAADVSRMTADEQAASIAAAAEIVVATFRGGGKMLLCGNGGSAADCQHMAAELVGRLNREIVRPALPAIALTTDTSFLTAHANDVGFDDVFARQVQALGSRGDVLIAISTSGRSPNIIVAVERARTIGLAVVALTGPDGPLADAADVAVRVPTSDTQLIQQTHLAVEHLICELVERALCS